MIWEAIFWAISTTHPIRIFSMFHTFFRRINRVEPDLRQGLGGPAAGIGLDAHAAGGLSLGVGEEVGISFGGSMGFSINGFQLSIFVGFFAL